MSHLFQRPLCEMGMAYDFAFRPVVGELGAEAGGGCDDRPHPVALFAAAADVRSPEAEWRRFALCPEHEGQLRAADRSFVAQGHPSRFRP